MIDIYRIQFAALRASETNAVRESPTPTCAACATGHHEQPMLAHESCDCPCHGAPLDFAEYKVAA